MEILRFDENEAPRSSKRKTSVGWIVTGVIAVTLGLGTAFATSSTTITINGTNSIALGQGVAATATCDTDISLTPNTEITPSQSPSPGAPASDITFQTSKLTLASVNTSSTGCGGKAFKIDFYHNSGGLTPIDCATGATTLTFDLNDYMGTKVGSSYTGNSNIKCMNNSLYILVPIVTTSNTAQESQLIVQGLGLNPNNIDYITLISTEYPQA